MNRIHEQQSLFDDTHTQRITYRRTYAYRVSMVREKQIRFNGGDINNSAKAAEVIRNTIDAMGQNDREHFVVVMLNTRNHIVGTNIASVGSVNATQIRPMEAFKPAIMMSAPAMIIGHNHPSGNIQPSPDDLAITQKLLAAGELLGIQIHDHVIVATDSTSYYSIADRGGMANLKRNAKTTVEKLESLDW